MKLLTGRSEKDACVANLSEFYELHVRFPLIPVAFRAT